MSNTPTHALPDFTSLARQKMTRVLGPARAEELLQQILVNLKLPLLASADDLHRFGQALSTYGAYESATGALLCLQATMKGSKLTAPK